MNWTVLLNTYLFSINNVNNLSANHIEESDTSPPGICLSKLQHKISVSLTLSFTNSLINHNNYT